MRIHMLHVKWLFMKELCFYERTDCSDRFLSFQVNNSTTELFALSDLHETAIAPPGSPVWVAVIGMACVKLYSTMYTI